MSPYARPRPLPADQRVRLLIVNSTLHIGGAEQVAACLAKHICRDQFDVTACYLKECGIIGEQMNRDGVGLIPLPGLKEGNQDYFTSLRLRRLITARKIDVIHTHDLHGLIDGAICRMTRPGLRHVHTLHFGNYPNRPPRSRAIESTFWRIPDALVAVGHAQAAAVKSLYRIPDERLRVIWNGVEDPGSPSVRPVSEVPIIASIGTLIAQKGVHFLLQAAAILRSSGDRFLLLIAGEGHLRGDLERQSRDLGLSEYVRFLGWVPQASRELLPTCDIFVQSSLWEAMSIVVLEAMAAAKPIAVTTVGENPHVIQDGKTGLTVQPGDPEALAAALRLLLRDHSFRSRLGMAARARYENCFTVQHMISEHECLYDELAHDK